MAEGLKFIYHHTSNIAFRFSSANLILVNTIRTRIWKTIIQAPHVPERAGPSRVDPFGSESCRLSMRRGVQGTDGRSPARSLVRHDPIRNGTREPCRVLLTLTAENRTSIEVWKYERPGLLVPRDGHTRSSRSVCVNRE